MSQGWRIVAAVFVLLTISSGLGFYNMSVYVVELSRALDVAVADISVAVSLFFVAGGVGGVLLARLIDRYDLRLIMCLGALVAGLSLFAAGQTRSLGLVYTCFAVFGFSGASVSLVTATTLVARWFPGPRQALAMSVAFTGLSLGGVLLTPFSAYLFNLLGPAQTFNWLALMFLGVTIPCILFFIRLPSTSAHPADPGVQHQAYRDTIRSRFFVLMAMGYVLCMAAQVGGIAHLYGRVESIGGYAGASYAVQVLSLGSIVGRLLGGFVAGMVRIKVFTLVMLVGQLCGLLVVGYADSLSMALAGSLITGLSVGNLLMSQPLWLAQRCPPTVYARVYALANAVTVVGVASGPFVLGVLVDTASYAHAYLTAGALCATAWVVLYFAGREPRSGSVVKA